eukprot:1181933-Alexandrium_andersonii.AAC.1
MSSSRRGRKSLRDLQRPRRGALIPVKGAIRDLGAHLNLTKAWGTGILKTRMAKATEVAHRLCKL